MKSFRVSIGLVLSVVGFGAAVGCGNVVTDNETLPGQTVSSSSSGGGGEGGQTVSSSSSGGGGSGGMGCTDASTCESGRACVDGSCVAVCQMNTWIDLTGHGHDGMLENFGPDSWVGDGTPEMPYALAFDGADDIVKVLPAADGLQFAEELSVEVWAIPETPAHYYKGLFGARTTDSYDGYILAQCHMDGYVPNPDSWGWYTCPTGNCPYWAEIYSDTSASIATQWYHVAGTFSLTEGMQRLYVNGVKQKDEQAVAAPILYAQDMALTVGNAVTGLASFQGRMAIVRVWSRALTGEEVADLFAKDAARFGLSSPPPVNDVSDTGLALHYEAGPCQQ